ncbi:DNA polymerase II large subunit, partial [Candidatus Woesearchaeota archaeon]|nr:DNA polymerase II large subunit [Candidatus Woesearchaeota archaeon]
MNLATSPEIERYFNRLNEQVTLCYDRAALARSKGLDPETTVPIPLAKNMAERVVGLISVVAPKIMETTITQRIMELEKIYGLLDWRVGFVIAEEVARGTIIPCDSKEAAIELGIRVGFAYLTLGIVSAPLEGFIGLVIKKRRDGKEYFALQYAGPIRGAGGTAASTSVLLADYVRVKMGYAPYDPDETEVNRYVTEVQDYHERVTNLQYFPSVDELRFMVSHLPVEVDGDPTETFEVSNYKDLPRIPTNMIRGGVALVLAEGLSQKAPKLWKRLSKWGQDFQLGHWSFLADFMKLKEEIHAAQAGTKGAVEEKKVVKPNNTFIMDLVAGRPILTHPLAEGGFRLRYGRTRVSGFSACGIHPATLRVLNNYIAIGTQLKVERPGKAASVTVCEVLEGPIVRLRNGSIMQLQTEEEAKLHFSEVEEVLFLGDILFNYGDFSENGHCLVPVGYCPEWWVLEVERAAGATMEDVAARCGIDLERWQELTHNAFTSIPTWDEALSISRNLAVPLHPSYVFYWKLVKGEELLQFTQWLSEGKFKHDEKGITKLILPYYRNNAVHEAGKEVLHKLGVSHVVINKENIVLEQKEAVIIAFHFGTEEKDIGLSLERVQGKNGLEVINSLSEVLIRDKAGTFIGARMGRPEKAKMRQMTGSPQVMFPVGEEGDRLRSFQSALQAGKISSVFPTYYCRPCQRDMIYPQCEECHQPCERKYFCRFCGDLMQESCRHGNAVPYKSMDLDIAYYFAKAAERLGENIYPDLIKGIRGTSNKNHVVEHLTKGLLRAKHTIYVNKDGTTRYDCTELPLTHFKPKEIKTSVVKLQELGYTHDISGNPLVEENQLLELKPQDIIIPAFDSLDESAPKVLKRVAEFVDDLLVNFYGLEPFYNLSKEEDLIGHLVIGLAPHISAGLVGRIIGFSETQGLITHPMFHAGLRRDCFDKNTYLPLYNGSIWEIRKIGEIVEKLNPTDVVDDYGTKEVRVSGINTIGASCQPVAVHAFTKHAPQPMIKCTTKLGRTLKVTFNHKQIIYDKNKPKVVLAHQLKIGDTLAIPYLLQIPKKDCPEINLFHALADQEWVMVRGVNVVCQEAKKEAKKHFSKRDYDNYTSRDSYPLAFIKELYRRGTFKDISRLRLAAKRDTVTLPTVIPITKEFLQIVGLYIAEGYSRKVPGRLYQMYIAAENPEIRHFVQKNMSGLFGLKITENKKDRLTYSSRIVYHLFTSILKCGSSAYEKRIPPQFLNLPDTKLGYLLSGYFEGDGSVSPNDLRATFDTVSEGLLRDLDFVFGQMGIFVKNYTYTTLPGPKVREFYVRKGRPIPSFTVTKGIIQSVFMKKFSQYVDFISSRKRNILSRLVQSRKATVIAQNYTSDLMFDAITSIELLPEEESYCLTVEGNIVIANSIITKQCDGDEAAVLLLMDALLNFSRQYLPEKRGAKTMDSPLVLTSILNPTEVDDQVHGMDVAWNYPLELYEAAMEMKFPWEVKSGVEKKKVEQIADRLGTPLQFEGFGFTHPVDNFNKGVRCSAYKTQPSMEEKLMGQMDIAKKVRAVNMDDVAKLVIQKHFLRDIKGNLRKFSMQQFRCVKCNEKFRRPPLCGKCTACGGKLIFTITEGSVVKYLGPSL